MDKQLMVSVGILLVGTISMFVGILAYRLRKIKKRKKEIVEEVKKEVEKTIKETNKTPNIHYSTEKTKIPKALTAKIPKTSQGKIVGREAELDDLHNRLFDNRQVVLVNGLGGIGKTTLAQVYIAKYWDEYCHIAWISQLSENIINNFINTEGLLDILKIQSEDKKSEELFINIMTELKNIDDGPNLLIIDNADANLSKRCDCLPNQPRWHVLVTSREQIHGFDLKELDFLSEDYATDLFLVHYRYGKINKEEIKELIKLVDFHTLTIEILAKTAQRQRTEIGQLKKAIADNLKANVYIDHKGDKIGKITSYLSSIFKMSKLSNNEIWVLKQFVCLPSEFHNYGFLKKLIKPEKSQKEDIFSEIIEELRAKGWLLKNQETDSYKMHRIIADVIKQQQTITLSDVEFIINSIIEKLNKDQTTYDPKKLLYGDLIYDSTYDSDEFQWIPWIPYGKSVLNIFPVSTDAKILELQNNLALALRSTDPEAKNLLEKAIRVDERKYGAEHPMTAKKYYKLALVLRDLGDYEGAKSLLEKAIRVDEKNFGKEHLSTVRGYFNLATVLKHLKDYKAAKNFYEKVMLFAEKKYGAEHPITTNSCIKLAHVLKCLGDYRGAKNFYEKIMLSAEKKSDEYEEAKKDLKEVLFEDQAQMVNADFQTMAVFYAKMALMLRDLDDVDYRGAKNFYEKIMLSAEKKYGADHSTAVSYSNFVAIVKKLGEYEEAKKLLEKAMQSDERKYGAEHPMTAKKYYNLALVLKDLGDYEGALELSERSVNIFKKVLPQGHPHIEKASNLYESIKQH